MSKLPPATLRSLEALDALPDKKMNYRDFCKATGVKSRAVHMLTSRLESSRYIVRHYGAYDGGNVEMTFAGMQALKAHRAI